MSLLTETGAPGVDDVRVHLAVQTITPVPVPADCADGSAGAYRRRPEAYLQLSVRAGISCLAILPLADAERGVQRLGKDLASGVWDARFGYLRELPGVDLGYRLVVAG